MDAQQLIFNAATFMDHGETEQALASLEKAVRDAAAQGNYVIVAEAQCFLAEINLQLKRADDCRRFGNHCRNTVETRLVGKVEPDLWEPTLKRLEEIEAGFAS